MNRIQKKRITSPIYLFLIATSFTIALSFLPSVVSAQSSQIEQKSNNLFLYGGIMFILISIIGLFIGMFSRMIVKRRRAIRFQPLDYSDIPYSERTYYEILSDSIMGMRVRVGDDALVIANAIEGLKIDKKTGRVLSFSDDPAKIIATLISEYERLLGKKVSFTFRQNDTKEKINS